MLMFLSKVKELIYYLGRCNYFKNVIYTLLWIFQSVDWNSLIVKWNILFENDTLFYNLWVFFHQGMSSVFFNKGENCIAAGRLFVEESIHDEYVERIVSTYTIYML